MIRELGTRGNLRLGHAADRRFPGLLVQGDTLSILLADLEEEAPEAFATVTVREWLAAYEEMMAEHGMDLPYRR